MLQFKVGVKLKNVEGDPVFYTTRDQKDVLEIFSQDEAIDLANHLQKLDEIEKIVLEVVL